MTTEVLDNETARAVRSFVRRLGDEFDVAGAFLFGSRARQGHRPDSDVDIAVLLHGAPGNRIDEALKMSDIAFDVLLDTGVVIEAIPFWEVEWAHPERFSNPALIENIRREGKWIVDNGQWIIDN